MMYCKPKLSQIKTVLQILCTVAMVWVALFIIQEWYRSTASLHTADGNIWWQRVTMARITCVRDTKEHKICSVFNPVNIQRQSPAWFFVNFTQAVWLKGKKKREYANCESVKLFHLNLDVFSHSGCGKFKTNEQNQMKRHQQVPFCVSLLWTWHYIFLKWCTKV